jgi:hypothetical protein
VAERLELGVSQSRGVLGRGFEENFINLAERGSVKGQGLKGSTGQQHTDGSRVLENLLFIRPY